MSISEFKSQVLQLIDTITKTRESLVITKRRKPIVQVSPYKEPAARPRPGKLAAYLVFEKDIVSPDSNL